jgi:Uma2 family endonuclease
VIPATILPGGSGETERSAIMATVSGQRRTREITYPTRDGRPMGETTLHMEDMIDTIQMLQDYYADQPNVFAWGNLLVCYEEGDRRKHVSPDVLVAFGVPKGPNRDHYLVWKEGKAPDVVVEITSKSTRREDKKKKFEIYRDIMKVREYFLFDPRAEYLDPPLQGFRLVGGDYVPIEPVDGRLPSEVLGLHLERDGEKLRLFNPRTGEYLQTPREGREAEHRRAEEERHRAEEERHRAEEERRRAEEERRRAEEAEAAQQRLAEEREQLLREIEALRRASKSE